MRITDKKEKNNEALMSRKEYVIAIEFDAAAPKKEDVKKELCKSLNCDEKMAVVKKISTHFGSRKAEVDFFVYTNESDMKRIETYLMHRKIAEKMQKAAGAAPAEEKKAEA